MKPLISCILTSYNKHSYLSDAIDSVLQQTLGDFELLIIDDNSTDGSYELAKKYEADDKRIIVLKTNLDASNHDVTLNRYTHNINQALKYVEGSYITYLCDDDWYFPDRFKRMAHYLDYKPDVQICYGIQQIANQEGGKLTMGALRNAPKVLFDAVCIVDHSSVMHRAELLTALGPSPWWPEGLETWRQGDAAFWSRLRDGGIPFFRIPGMEPTDVHRYNQLSVSYALDHPTFGPNARLEGADYTQRDDMGNYRTINSGVDPGWSHTKESA